jgi:exoribonuclease-2
VDAVVKKDSAVDRNAWRNAGTVYTDALIFPMLPEALSTSLTSLNESTDRIALVTDMVFGPDGTPISSTIYRALVRNHKKLTYNAVGPWLAGQSEIPVGVAEIPGLRENLLLQDAFAQLLEKVRHQHGALSLDTNDPTVPPNGSILSNLDSFRPNRAEQLIENCMIAANRASTTYLQSKKFPSFRRILRSPQRWDRLVQLAAGYHCVLPAAPDSAALETFLIQRQNADPPKFADLSLSVVKLIGHGEYALDVPGEPPVGHFGLAAKNYAHATAPNRRFADLITQRLLKAALVDAPVPYTIDELTGLAQHCTAQEISVAKVERKVHEFAAATTGSPSF